MAAMDQAIARLTQEVQEISTVADSAATLLHGLGNIIRQNANNPPALQALANTLDSKGTQLQDAVAANTIAENEPETPPTEPTEPEQPANPTP